VAQLTWQMGKGYVGLLANSHIPPLGHSIENSSRTVLYLISKLVGMLSGTPSYLLARIRILKYLHASIGLGELPISFNMRCRVVRQLFGLCYGRGGVEEFACSPTCFRQPAGVGGDLLGGNAG
jgi:hypothetical protein